MKTEWISLFYGGQLPQCIMDFDTITGGLVTGKNSLGPHHTFNPSYLTIILTD